MRLYTVQDDEIIEHLAGGHVHQQTWARSAAGTGTPADPDGSLHRAAYEYAVRQLQARIDLTVAEAPVFAFLSKKKALSTINVGRPSKLLTLDVPDAEVLLQDHGFWHWTILYGWCGLHAYDLEQCPDGCREASWSQSFALPADLSKCQAILSRIDPAWVVPFSEISSTQN